MFKNLLFAAIILLCAMPCQGKKNPPPPDPAWAGITARGRMLADYDIAVKHATDAVRAAYPAMGSVPDYVAEKTHTGWVVEFGGLNATRDKFLVSYVAAKVGTAKEFKAVQNAPPREDTSYFYQAAKGLELCKHDFPLEKRPYNFAVLPVESNQMYVYIYPAQTKPGIYTLGGDVRYLVSQDGSSIVEKRRLHAAVLEINLSGITFSGKLSGSWHTHTLSDVPEDTDVFYVLTRNPSGPEVVRTRKGNYQVREDGSIVAVK